MTREQALIIAERSADVAWRVVKAPKAFGWVESLSPAGGLVALARAIEARPDITAPELYRLAVTGQPEARPWLGTPRELRLAIECFAGMFKMLLRDVQAADVAARKARAGGFDQDRYAELTGGQNVLRFPSRGDTGGDAA